MVCGISKVLDHVLRMSSLTDILVEMVIESPNDCCPFHYMNSQVYQVGRLQLQRAKEQKHKKGGIKKSGTKTPKSKSNPIPPSFDAHSILLSLSLSLSLPFPIQLKSPAVHNQDHHFLLEKIAKRALTLSTRSLSIRLTLLGLLLKQLILKLVRQPLSLLLVLWRVDVSSTTAPKVLSAIFHAGTQGRLGDGFGVFTLSSV